MPTMETVAAPASTPAVTVPASAPKTAPAAPAQPTRKRGPVLIVSIAAVCLVLLIGASLAVVFLSKRGTSPEPVPAPNTNPVQNGQAAPDTPSGGTLVADTPAGTVRPLSGAGSGTQSRPDTGSVVTADIPRDQTSASAPATAANGVSAVRTQPAEMISDPLGKNRIVLLADTSAVSRKTKDLLVKAFGAENVSFQEAEGMARYKQLAGTIIKSDPSLVVLCFARQYAEDGISASGYGTVIGYHADRFQEEGVPCMFVQPSEDDDDDVRLKPYLDAATDICRQRSIPFIDEKDLTEDKLVPLVRENKKAE